MMNQLKEDERELVKLANYFRKRAQHLIEEGKLSQEHQQVIVACERLTNTIYEHSSVREEITQKRENVKSIIKDNAVCPQCESNSQLKFVGIDKNDKGWKFNKYKCRRCNIQFVWNRPNNPWDMISFTEEMAVEFDKKIDSETSSEEEKQQFKLMLVQVQENLNLIKPVIQRSDDEFEALQTRDEEISKMIKEFKNYLLIQKVLLDSVN
jgi:hypothetical protein